ncbi:MAG: ZPR1 zinc finger domain-containing protein [Candidatus Lokiarchaeota archaeon]|nr:ZPR1 zinc finger domain-containing protein [Candidatus Lokiarchaeota archaeon]
MANKERNNEIIYSFKCPSCQEGTINIFKSIYDLPDGDKMLILKFECNICNFHKNDVIPLTTNMEPGIMTLQITNEEDLKSKIYRSPVGKLEIPELELIVEPGPRADFYYTNVEGILYRFESAVSIYKNNLEKNDPEISEIEELLDNLQKAMDGRFKFTLVITDPQGGSYIIPQKKSKYTFKKIEKKDLE